MKLRNLATIYITDDDRILMMYRTGSRVFKESLWAGIGGHFEPDELNEPEKCVLRELWEETRITENDIVDLKLRYITTRKANDEIRQQYIFFAGLRNTNIDIPPCDEGEISWINIFELLKLEMSFTNGECLRHYYNTGINTAEIYSAVVKVIDNEPYMQFVALKDFYTAI